MASSLSITALALGGVLAIVPPETDNYRGTLMTSDGRSLSAGHVSLTGNQLNYRVTVLSDGAGNFEIPRVPPGEYQVEASHPDYQPLVTTLTVPFDEAPELVLEPAEEPFKNFRSSSLLDALPDGEELRRFIIDCTGCHQFHRTTVLGPERELLKTRAQWLERISQMLEQFGPASSFPIISQYRQAGATASWLVEHLGDGVAPDFREPAHEPSPLADRVVMTSYTFPQGFDLPHDLAIDREGQIVITGMFSGSMYRLDPASGEFARVRIPVPQANPRAVDLDSDGNWLVLLGGPRMIARYRIAEQTWETFDIPVYPHSIVSDPDGSVWYNGHFTASPMLYQKLDLATGERETFELDHPEVSGSPIPYEIRQGPDGTVWGSELVGNRLVRISPSGEVTSYPMPRPHTGPRRLDVDRQGVVWIPEYAGNALARFDPVSETFREFPIPRTNSLPYIARVHQASGRVWLAAAGADALLLFDPASETFSEIPLPDRRTLIRHLAVEQETGAVWAAYGHVPASTPRIVRVALRD